MSRGSTEGFFGPNLFPSATPAYLLIKQTLNPILLGYFFVSRVYNEMSHISTPKIKMAKKSSVNKGLPERWAFKNGAYYYRPKPGLESMWDGKTWFRLSANLGEAYRVWQERMGEDKKEIRTVGQLLDRYNLQVVANKSVNTQESNRISIGRLKKIFSPMLLVDMEPSYVYRYIDAMNGTTSAHRDKEVLSHAFTKATEWGLIRNNPIKGEVRVAKPKARSRLVEDWEIEAVCSMQPLRSGRDATRLIQSAIIFKTITGMRQQDMLTLKYDQITSDGIYYTPMKTEGSTGTKLLIEWTPALENAVAAARNAREGVDSEYLFCTETGGCYYDMEKRSAQGFKAMFRRFIDRAIKEKLIKERFTEHDLRAVAATTSDSLERASALLGHSTTAITKRVYRRGVTKVQPAK